ncbi:MAG: DUF192 domain-containing protein [Cyanobacteriota bacterium]
MKSNSARSLPWLVITLALLLGCDRRGQADDAATAQPPQHLPVTARWCLDRGPCLELEEARTPLQQMFGLQMREPLPPLRGMWFPFAPPTPARFWMHRTPAPLDMIFVRDGRVLVVVEGATPCMRLPCPSYGPGVPVDGVLEVAAGRAAALGIVTGVPVRIEPINAPKPR